MTHFFTGGMSAEGQAKALERVQDFFANRMIFFALLLIIMMIAAAAGAVRRAGAGRRRRCAK